MAEVGHQPLESGLALRRNHEQFRWARLDDVACMVVVGILGKSHRDQVLLIATGVERVWPCVGSDGPGSGGFHLMSLGAYIPEWWFSFAFGVH